MRHRGVLDRSRSVMQALMGTTALPGASFVLSGASQARDSALTTESVEMTWLNGWSTAATFEGEFSDTTRSYAGKGAIRYGW